MKLYILCLAFLVLISSADSATKCYKCDQCHNLENMEVINCASYWYKLAALSYDTKYSCQANSESLRNVTKYTLSCTPASECTMATQYQDGNGAWKWSKCCQDDLCNLGLVNKAASRNNLFSLSVAFVCLVSSTLALF